MIPAYFDRWDICAAHQALESFGIRLDPSDPTNAAIIAFMEAEQ